MIVTRADAPAAAPVSDSADPLDLRKQIFDSRAVPLDVQAGRIGELVGHPATLSILVEARDEVFGFAEEERVAVVRVFVAREGLVGAALDRRKPEAPAEAE